MRCNKDEQMKTIYKFELVTNPDKVQSINLPEEAEILKVDVQADSHIMLWALVETDNSLEERKIYLAWTGKLITESKLKYINSFTTYRLVWHAFEVLP